MTMTMTMTMTTIAYNYRKAQGSASDDQSPGWPAPDQAPLTLSSSSSSASLVSPASSFDRPLQAFRILYGLNGQIWGRGKIGAGDSISIAINQRHFGLGSKFANCPAASILLWGA